MFNKNLSGQKGILLKITLFMFFVIIVFSECNSGNEKVSYVDGDSDSTMLSKTIKNGEFIWYFEGTKTPSTIAYYKNDTLEGEVREYYKDGSIKSVGSYCKGQLCGEMKIFDESGKLMEERVYTPCFGVEDYFLNTWKKYDENGKIIPKESHYYELKEPELPIKLNGSAKLEFDLVAPYFDENYKLVTGRFDEYFKPLSDIDTVLMKSSAISIDLPTNKIGKNNIRFIVHEIRWPSDSVEQIKSVLVEYDYIVE